MQTALHFVSKKCCRELHKSMNNEQQILEQLVAHFGFEKLIAELPQRKACEALKLVTPNELATSLGLSYGEFRWQLHSGVIPHPSLCLVRRNYFTATESRTFARLIQSQTKFSIGNLI